MAPVNESCEERVVVRRLNRAVAVMAIAALAGGGVLAGCSDSDSSEAETPAAAETITNTALQTDSEGNTLEAPSPGPDGASTGVGSETGGDNGQQGGDGDAGGDAVGDVAAGQGTFEGVCQGCHAQGGQQAAVGPKLAQAGGHDAATVHDRAADRLLVEAGLVQGPDQDNVVAYVLSIQ
jgi:hypothetical protein